MEILSKIKGYEDIYYIGSDYNIYSAKSGKKLKKQETNAGYYRVQLYKKGTNKRISVHRIIAENLVGNTENKTQVNHIDNNRKNNHPSNLEWTTQSENMKHMHNQKRHKRSVKGEKNRILQVKRKQGKLTYLQAEEIRNIKNMSQRDIAKLYNVSQFLIGRVLRYETYKKEDFIL